LANISSAEQKLVTGNLGICRSFTKGRDKELRPAMHVF